MGGSNSGAAGPCRSCPEETGCGRAEPCDPRLGPTADQRTDLRTTRGTAMIRRLNVYGFCLGVVTGLLPLLAHFAAWCARLRPIGHASFDPAVHLHFAVLTTMVWMVMARHYGVINAAQLLSCRPGARSAVMACLTTYLTVFAAAFFHRGAAYSSAVVLLSAAILFLLTIATQAAFRSAAFLRLRRHKLRIAVIGVDRFARRTGARLQRASGK